MTLSGQIRSKELLEKEVIGQQGWKIGKISDVVIDTSSWQVAALEVELEKSISKEFRMKRLFRKTAIPVKPNYIQGIGDRLILKYSKEDLRKLIASEIPPQQR